MSKVEVFRQHHFEDVEQQHEASWLGMWVFLATEVMFFGGMFACYFVYRHWYLQAFAEASNHLDVLLGGINTAVLICSSFTMALAVHSAETNERNALIIFLGLTIVLGTVFLGIKFFEYHSKFEEHLVPGSAFAFPGPFERQAEIFFSFYFAMTGMHAVHMIIGIGLLTALDLSSETRPLLACSIIPRSSSRVSIGISSTSCGFFFSLYFIYSGRHV